MPDSIELVIVEASGRELLRRRIQRCFTEAALDRQFQTATLRGACLETRCITIHHRDGSPDETYGDGGLGVPLSVQVNGECRAGFPVQGATKSEAEDRACNSIGHTRGALRAITLRNVIARSVTFCYIVLRRGKTERNHDDHCYWLQQGWCWKINDNH